MRARRCPTPSMEQIRSFELLFSCVPCSVSLFSFARIFFFFFLQHCVRRFTTSMTVDTGGYSSCQGTDPAAVAPHLWLWDSPICPIRNTKRLCFQDQCRIEVKVQVMLSTLLRWLPQKIQCSGSREISFYRPLEVCTHEMNYLESE
jgi:hypothetical protein